MAAVQVYELPNSCRGEPKVNLRTNKATTHYNILNYRQLRYIILLLISYILVIIYVIYEKPHNTSVFGLNLYSWLLVVPYVDEVVYHGDDDNLYSMYISSIIV